MAVPGMKKTKCPMLDPLFVDHFQMILESMAIGMAQVEAMNTVHEPILLMAHEPIPCITKMLKDRETEMWQQNDMSLRIPMCGHTTFNIKNYM